jgi:hypothetical protein
MAVTSVGAIYATVSLLLQRVYIPSADDSEISAQHIGAGETLALVPIATWQSGGPQAVQAAIGIPTFSGRCALVAAGTVVDHIIADPAFYSDPSGRLVIAHDTTCVGDTWTGTIFTRSFAEFVPATGIVVVISTQNIDTAVPQTPGNLLSSLPPGSSVQVGQNIHTAVVST